MEAGPRLGANIVHLRIEAVEANVHLARLVGSGLASQAGMTVEELDDLRLAIDEACWALIASGAQGALDLRFELSGPSLTVGISGHVGEPVRRLPAPSAGILDAVTAGWSLSSDRDHACVLLESRVVHDCRERDDER
jgi:hypothetical protein